VIAAIDRKVRRRGAEDSRYLVAFGAGSLRPVDDRPLAAGDIITLYVAVEAQRYWAETTRSFVLGTASGELRDLFARGERALAAMHTVARAGSPAADLARAARSALGDDELYRTAALYGLGHGIGLDADEDPAITESNASLLTKNATLATRVILRRGDVGIGLSQLLIARASRADEIDKPASLVEIHA
jgi:Xaa-Pro aminopeptidase